MQWILPEPLGFPLMPNTVARVRLFGLPIDALTLDQAIRRTLELLDDPGLHQQVSINVDKVVLADRDPALRSALGEAALITADGMPIVWASRLLGRPLPERIAGIDLFERLLSALAGRHPIYLLGARREVVAQLVDDLRERHPSLVVAGWRDGYWAPAEEESVVQAIRESGARALFIAMGSPRKELFVTRWEDALGVRFAMGVGGSFDVLTGRVSRAPGWVRRFGLEWLHRLAKEPRRMWRRYLVRDPWFLVLVLRELRRRS